MLRQPIAQQVHSVVGISGVNEAKAASRVLLDDPRADEERLCVVRPAGTFGLRGPGLLDTTAAGGLSGGASLPWRVPVLIGQPSASPER